MEGRVVLEEGEGWGWEIGGRSSERRVVLGEGEGCFVEVLKLMREIN